MCMHMCTDVYSGMCIDMCIDICMDMCADIRLLCTTQCCKPLVEIVLNRTSMFIPFCDVLC